MPIVVGEFEPTKLPKKLLVGLFLASQVTQVQRNDESYGSARCAGDGLGSLRGELHVRRALRGAAGDLP